MSFNINCLYLRKSARSAGDFCSFICAILIEYSCVLFSRRLRRSRRENAAGCNYYAEKYRLGNCSSFVVLGFVCVNLRDQRDTLGFHLSNID